MNKGFEKYLKIGLFSLVNTLLITEIGIRELPVAAQTDPNTTRSATDVPVAEEPAVGVLTVGNPPKAYRIEGGPEDRETAWFFEAFYKHQLNDYISLTPGVFLITNPEDNREPLLVGVIRLGFFF